MRIAALFSVLFLAGCAHRVKVDIHPLLATPCPAHMELWTMNHCHHPVAGGGVVNSTCADTEPHLEQYCVWIDPATKAAMCPECLQPLGLHCNTFESPDCDDPEPTGKKRKKHDD